MAERFASGKNAIAECDVCGFRYKLRELRNLVKKDKVTNIMACPTCWNEDHPQNKLGMYPVDDPQAIRNPRPDFAGYAQSRAQIVAVTSTGGINPAGKEEIPPVIGAGFIGQVVVTTS